MIKYSVILPIYNQEKQIDFLYTQYTEKLTETGDSWELLLIVNGSRDKSFETAQKMAAKNPNVRVFNLEKGGWGRAVKFGLSEARGAIVCYTNSARTIPEQLILVLKYSSANSQVVLKTTRVARESLRRKMGSILYNYENRLLLGTPLWDVNGTPKVIPAQFLKDLNITEEGDLIDAEIMARIYRKNIQIIEILIVSPKRIEGQSTTKLKSAIKMYTGLWRLKRNLDAEAKHAR